MGSTAALARDDEEEEGRLREAERMEDGKGAMPARRARALPGRTGGRLPPGPAAEGDSAAYGKGAAALSAPSELCDDACVVVTCRGELVTEVGDAGSPGEEAEGEREEDIATGAARWVACVVVSFSLRLDAAAAGVVRELSSCVVAADGSADENADVAADDDTEDEGAPAEPEDEGGRGWCNCDSSGATEVATGAPCSDE